MHNAIATRKSSLTKNATEDFGKSIEDVVQRVSGPGQLPRAEVGLPALLVEIGKDEKEQNRDKTRD